MRKCRQIKAFAVRIDTKIFFRMARSVCKDLFLFAFVEILCAKMGSFNRLAQADMDSGLANTELFVCKSRKTREKYA